MNELYTYIFILFIMSMSFTIVLYIIIDEYKHIKNLKYIQMILESETDSQLLLNESKKKKEKKTFLYRVNDLMLLAGFEFSTYIFLFYVSIVLIVFAVIFQIFLQHWSGWLFGAAFGLFIVYLVIQAIITKRKNEFNRALATSISVLVKMMKNGIGFEQALFKAINVSNSTMFKKIFQNFFQEKNTIGEAEAFANLNQYIKSKQLLIFALAIKIGRASGGQFSNTLEKVEKTILYRKNLQDKVDVITREGSIGSYIVVAIAVFLYFTLDGNFDGKLHHYFMSSEYGRFQLLGIMVWVLIGIVLNKFITKVPT